MYRATLVRAGAARLSRGSAMADAQAVSAVNADNRDVADIDPRSPAPDGSSTDTSISVRSAQDGPIYTRPTTRHTRTILMIAAPPKVAASAVRCEAPRTCGGGGVSSEA
eukprot:scaffold1182_cov396-Prasinococcus_capsulatus_cf.AAC.3